MRIPARLLHPALRQGERSEDGQLEYGRDGNGAFAAYRLRPGEALYSSVVVRFTGRTAQKDVNGLAERIARLSGVRDLTDIPAQYPIKIPLDELEPEFLPRGHPRRREADAARSDAEAELARRPVGPTRDRLQGVIVILDAGHGGRDLGTMNYGIWEHDYVYDVACRLEELLERRTSARVFLTIEDMVSGCAPSAGDRLEANRQGTLKTTPPFLATNDGDSEIAVHLRWYLANAILRKAVREGTGPDRVVFLSLHADSRHPSMRGLMVYVPGARHRGGSYGAAASVHQRFRESREAPRVRFGRQERVRSEAVSRRLGMEIVASFGRENLPVQPYTPIRSEVIRSGRRWLPAVLRGSAVPASALVEMLNLGNREDAQLLSSADSRQRIAEALLGALFGYFGERPPKDGGAPSR